MRRKAVRRDVPPRAEKNIRQLPVAGQEDVRTGSIAAGRDHQIRALARQATAVAQPISRERAATTVEKDRQGNAADGLGAQGNLKFLGVDVEPLAEQAHQPTRLADVAGQAIGDHQCRQSLHVAKP